MWIDQQRWPSCPLNGRDIFNLFFETAQRNLTTLDRKQVLKHFYKMCVLQATCQKGGRSENFWLLLCNRWTDFFLENWELANIRRTTKFVFFFSEPIRQQWLLPVGLRHFDFLCNHETNFEEAWKEASTQCLYSSDRLINKGNMVHRCAILGPLCLFCVVIALCFKSPSARGLVACLPVRLLFKSTKHNAFYPV